MDDAITRLMSMQDYHQEQLDRVRDALALLKEGNKIAAKAERLTRKVQTRMGHATPEPRVSAQDFVRQHADTDARSPSVDIRRLLALAHSQGYTFRLAAMSASWFKARTERRTGKTAYEIRLEKDGKTRKLERRNVIASTARAATVTPAWKRKAQAKRSGDNVTNRLRVALAAHGSAPISRADLQVAAKIEELVGPRFVGQSTAKVLERMAKNKEVKQTKAGWVALKLQPPTPGTAANGNGAHA